MQRRNFIQTTALSSAGITLANSGMANSNLAAKSVKRPLCAFTKCLQFMTFDQIAEVLPRLGFDGADVTVRPGGQIEPENTKAELPKAVKALQKSGIALPMIVTAVTDTDNPVDVTLLQVAADAGIKYYRMGWLPYDLTKTIQQNLDGFKGKFERLAKLNEKLGIHGGYQNHSGLHVGAPVWDLYDLIKDVNPKYLGVQYDIRHAQTEGGYSWLLGMKRVEPWIRTICVKDFIWGKDAKGIWHHQNVMLGEGMVSFDEFLKEYDTLKIEAPISMHFEYDLGGAETGKKTTTMDPEKIFGMMKTDLDWIRGSMAKNKIEY
ncbi:MAG: TIM barrel protein [Prolixibacteraceae bacterium]